MIDNHIFENKKAAYYTLGCKLNFAETSTIGKHLSDNGIRKALPDEKADICVVNTCSVTELADKKCRQAIRKISRRHPGAFVVVVGCYAQLKPEEVSRIEGVDLVLGMGEKMDILEKINAKEGMAGQACQDKIKVSPIAAVKTFVPSCSKDDRTRHFLKVQDGCDYYCSYCTIPFARGRSRNGSIVDLVKMAEAAGNEGGKEIVLTGVNIGDFGKSTGETFFDLLKALEKVESIERFRISSIEPNLLTDEILQFVSQSRRFAPHFHIPLQSGSDEVLKLMRRKYDTPLFASKINRIRELMPDAFVGVDVIVGVRGETDEYFETALKFIESLPISQLHVFTYSERPGTMALHIDYVVNPKVKQERSKRLLDISQRKLRSFYQSQIGTAHKILFEQAKKGNKMYGFTENYVKIEADYQISWINKLIPVTLSGFNEDETTLTI
ncbi:MAG: tRNA (N(6)-L-threonylcarbamoyladenosine(37)-C(2))-methylthiotransferase MtaB [Dysgonamonadaceae bacterium]|jgi:threonylcarbamoyladenosine tRNA methylthiotransferase MtaB|nr:tRNA (N(6)-L-threonylcarbamoyladenosine(37)-C(2))-methylthiotransferase MtaB [Dysgonamonadaceae bacterium]